MADRCKTCKADVRWIRMRKSGKANPLDVVPDSEKGNVVIGADGLGETLAKSKLAEARAAAQVLYISHWATCPDRQEWRERVEAEKARSA